MSDWISIALGLLFMVGAFLTKGIRGGLSGGPLRPISLTGRIVFFLAGFAVLVDGIRGLIGRH